MRTLETVDKKLLNSSSRHQHLRQVMKIALSPNVAMGLDGISVPLLKLISLDILESLTKVLNSSIQSGICPSALKLARVTTVLSHPLIRII